MTKLDERIVIAAMGQMEKALATPKIMQTKSHIVAQWGFEAGAIAALKLVEEECLIILADLERREAEAHDNRTATALAGEIAALEGLRDRIRKMMGET